MLKTVRQFVFARAWLTFVVLALSFVAFGIASLNLVTLLKATLALFL